MISYTLICAKEHEFEGWFQNAAAFDEQKAARKIVCPVCGSKKVEKGLMAPSVATAERKQAARETKMKAALYQGLKQMRAEVEKNCDYVGADFAEEARKIHYGETEARNIYGEATPEEARELDDEGIEVQAIPWVDSKEN